MEKHKGSSKSSSNGKPQRKAYAKLDAKPPEWYRGSIPVMVGITAQPGMTEQRSPVDIVLVLHVCECCNVSKNWEHLLSEAMEAVVMKLTDKDRLAAVPFQSSLTTAREAAWAARHSFWQVRSDTSLVRALELAESILHGRGQEDKETRPGYIIAISNSSEDTGSLFTWRFRSIHAFGFRDAHNARTMHTISDSNGCTYSLLDDEHGRITTAFFACVDRITTVTTTMPTQIKLICDQKVIVSAIDTPGVNCIVSDDMKVGIIWPSAHLAGVTINFIIYLGNVDTHQDDLTKLFAVYLIHENVSEKIGVQVVAMGTGESKEVVKEIVRIEAVKIVAAIVAKDKNDWEQLHEAADYLREQWTMLKSSACGKEAGEADLIAELAVEMQEMEIRLYNNYFWLEYMLSWQSHQLCQLPRPQESTNDSLIRLSILAKIAEQHKEGLPVQMRILAPEVGLAKVKRESVDLICVLDTTYGAKEMAEKTHKRLSLLTKAKKIANKQIKEKKTMEKLQKKLKPLDSDMAEKEREINDIREKLERIMKGEMIVELEMKEELEKRRKLLNEAMDQWEMDTEWRKLKNEVTEKLLEIERMGNEIYVLENQAKDMEKELETVMDNTPKRLELLIKAMELVTKKLSNKDRLAIIPAQSSATEPAADLLEMSKQGRRENSTKVQSLVRHVVRKLKTASANKAAKTLDWSEQPNQAMKQIRNCLDIIAPKLSIGAMTSAKGQSTGSSRAHSADVDGNTNLWKALTHAIKILNDRQGKEKDRVGVIIVVSDSNDDSICLENIRSNYVIHAFGFFNNHNSRALYHIASSSNGIYDILNNDRNQITTAFTARINKITTTIATDTKVEIICSKSSSLVMSSIESGQYKSSLENSKSCSILIGTLYAGEVRNFTVYVDKVSEDDSDIFSKLFTVHANWLHAMSKVEGKLDGQVVIVRNGVRPGPEAVRAVRPHRASESQGAPMEQ